MTPTDVNQVRMTCRASVAWLGRPHRRAHTTVMVAVAFAVVAAVPALTGCVARPTGQPAAEYTNEIPASVQRIIDGDTLDVTLDDGTIDRVRIIGIDTPELAWRGTDTRPPAPAECWADEATIALTDLIPVGTAITLIQDTTPRDRFDRLLAYVHRTSDNLDIGHRLVLDGHATTLTIEPNTSRADLYHDAEHHAADAARGLWGACPR